jgi:XTP/dITP diphosphohydrolase
MKITEILIASGNKGKVVEIADLLKKINISAISAADFDLEEPEETGDSFEKNSVLKARYYGDKTGLVSLADDSGLCIDFLGGKPGIHSARWAINEDGSKDFRSAFKKIRQELILKGIDLKNQIVKAHFVCNLTVYNPQSGQIKSFEGRVYGKISFPPKGLNGFGYDPIFIAIGSNQTFGEISPKDKDKISHRTKAFSSFVDFCK